MPWPWSAPCKPNLAPHKSDLTLELIRAAGAQVRFLPACSPGLNRIETAHFFG